MSKLPTLQSLRPARTPPSRPGPAGGKRDANRHKRTQALCEAALKLFLERGIEVVTIDDIVGVAGMAKGSFYRYFGDKSDLVQSLVAPLGTRVRSAFAECEQQLRAPGARQQLSEPYLQLAAELTGLVVQDSDVVRLYLQECRSPAVGARTPIVQLARDIAAGALALSTLAAEHGLTRELDPRLTSLAVTGAVEHLIFRFLGGDSLGPTEAIPATLIGLILDGVVRKR